MTTRKTKLERKARAKLRRRERLSSPFAMFIDQAVSESYGIDPTAKSPATALDYGPGAAPDGNPRSGDLAKGWF